jgi:hypothetical protein
MGAKPQQGLTLILGRAREGDERARSELVTLVYDELRRVASRRCSGSGPTTPSRPPRWSTRP